MAQPPTYITPLIDAPAPLPAEGVWTGETGELPNWAAMPRRNRRRKRRGSLPIWLRYLGWSIGVAVLVTIGQIAYHTVRADPRDARVYAERELRLSVLRPNERVLAEVSVWQRPAIDYFRATRGLLVLTDAPGDSAKPVGGRLIYLGLQPRDPLSAADAPPTFDDRSWPVDTLVKVTPGRTLLWLSRALRIDAPREHLTAGVPTPASAEADVLLRALGKKYAVLRAVGWQRREQRRSLDRGRSVALYQGRREWFHTVRSGQALASVARMYNTTPEDVRSLNGIVGDRIKIGQVLRVKGWTKQPVAFPVGVMPEFTPPADPP